MSKYLKMYFLLIAVLFGLCIVALWAIDRFDLAPQLRLLTLLMTFVLVLGFTRSFWRGKRDGD